MWTALALLVCLSGHPDRCATYRLVTNAPPAMCELAARQYLADRPYLEPVRAECHLETGA